MSRRQLSAITEVGDGIHFVEGPGSNWILLDNGESVSLVDTGYPADYDLVLGSIRAIGRDPHALQTILLTHGHSDHMGNAARLSRAFGAVVLCDPRERPNVLRDELHQIGLREVLARIYDWRVVRWALAAVRAGGLRDVRMVAVETFVPTTTMALSGHRVRPIATAGHTPGHSGFWLMDARLLITGDALVTAHPTSSRRGPQLLPQMFHADAAAAVRALGAFSTVDPVLVLPGHGPAMRSATVTA